MVLTPCTTATCQHLRRFLGTGVIVATVLAPWIGSQVANAQRPGMHDRQTCDMPPGAIGRWQVQQGGPLAGYFQPVEIKAPRGALISLAHEGFFDRGEPSPRGARMLVGNVYRFQVTNIPGQPGAELFPTVEVIDRTYPPSHQASAFPVEVAITQEDLILALQGRLVTRVVYLEDPHRALPTRQPDGQQEWFEAGEGEDPLDVARTLGRPMAILRIGGRVPGQSGPTPQFMYGSPPWIPFEIQQRPAELRAPVPARPMPEGAAPEEAAEEQPMQEARNSQLPSAAHWSNNPPAR